MFFFGFIEFIDALLRFFLPMEADIEFGEVAAESKTMLLKIYAQVVFYSVNFFILTEICIVDWSSNLI